MAVELVVGHRRRRYGRSPSVGVLGAGPGEGLSGNFRTPPCRRRPSCSCRTRLLRTNHPVPRPSASGTSTRCRLRRRRCASRIRVPGRSKWSATRACRQPGSQQVVFHGQHVPPLALGDAGALVGLCGGDGDCSGQRDSEGDENDSLGHEDPLGSLPCDARTKSIRSFRARKALTPRANVLPD